MNKNSTFDHSQHPNQESKLGKAPYASSTRVNYSTNDSRVEQFIDRESWWHRIKKFFSRKSQST